MQVFDGSDFEGKRVSFPIGDFTTVQLDDLGMQDKINGIKVPVGMQVTLYHDEFSGVEQTYTGPF